MNRAAPPGFDLEPIEGGFLLFRRGSRDAPLVERFRSGRVEIDSAPAYAGRGTIHRIDLAGERYVVRRYRHGGLLRWLTGDRYAGPGRAFREVALYDELQRRGVATLDAVAVLAIRRPPFGYRLTLVTREVGESCDLLAFLERRETPRTRREAIAEAGRAVARLHDAGFRHLDLHLKNLLVTPGPAVLVIDLDRGIFVPALSTVARDRVLARLYRSLVRLGEKRGRPLASGTEVVRFLRAGLGEGWRERVRSILGTYRRALPLHRFGWRLERWVRRPQPTAAG